MLDAAVSDYRDTYNVTISIQNFFHRASPMEDVPSDIGPPCGKPASAWDTLGVCGRGRMRTSDADTGDPRHSWDVRRDNGRTLSTVANRRTSPVDVLMHFLIFFLKKLYIYGSLHPFD